MPKARPTPQKAIVSGSPALLGSAFDLETLAVALDVTPAAAWATLWPAVADGLVIALDDAYRAHVRGKAEAPPDD